MPLQRETASLPQPRTREGLQHLLEELDEKPPKGDGYGARYRPGPALGIGSAAAKERARKGTDGAMGQRIAASTHRPLESPRSSLTPPAGTPRTQGFDRRPPAPKPMAPADFSAVQEFRRDLRQACGSLEEAFKRMDVFQTGLVSCLEFQEVVSEALGISVDKAFGLFELIDSGRRGVISYRDVSGDERAEKPAFR